MTAGKARPRLSPEEQQAVMRAVSGQPEPAAVLPEPQEEADMACKSKPKRGRPPKKK